MKTKSVLSALDKILKRNTTIEKHIAYIVGDRRVVVIDQGGNAIALPMIGTQVVHNGNYTIKNLVSFLTEGLNADQADYLKTVKAMYSQATNEKLISMAKDYSPMGGQ